MSAKEITTELNSDYLSNELVKNEFAIKITIKLDKTDLTDGTLVNAGIVTDSVKPIDFLLG
jgi:hypothetical protein